MGCNLDSSSECSTSCRCVEARENTYYTDSRGATEECYRGLAGEESGWIYNNEIVLSEGTYGALNSKSVSVYKVYKQLMAPPSLSLRLVKNKQMKDASPMKDALQQAEAA